MQKVQTIGLLLWRGGLLLASGSVAFFAIRAFLAAFELPGGIVLGLALVGAGSLMVFGSLIAERWIDLRNEREAEP